MRFTEPVVIIDVTSPAAVRITSSETTLSDTIVSMVPGNRFRMLVLMLLDRRRDDLCAGGLRIRACQKFAEGSSVTHHVAYHHQEII